MKRPLIIILLFITTIAQSQNQREFEVTEGDTTYTMKQYFMVFLVKGDNRDQSNEDAQKLQQGHLAHINKLAEEGYVVMSGPFGDDGDMRGILLFDVDSAEKAVELESQDPAVLAGRLKIEVRPWWGAKGTVLK